MGVVENNINDRIISVARETLGILSLMRYLDTDN
jgi:hypothetical protein